MCNLGHRHIVFMIDASTVVPMEVFQEESLHKLLVKHVRKLLMSDRVDRLKSILIFLLHSVGLFDMALQASILLALHDAFDHLFRHWFRDVRFCYHLVLLYLFGDRRQLGSRSDAILLGLDTDIVVLQRHPLWLQFDERLLDALEGCRSATRTTPYDRTSFNEYIGQLEHYYQSAESLPDGEAVPIPRIKVQAPNSRGDDFRASMDELVLLPTPTMSITILCVTLYIVVGMTALYRSVVPRPLPVTRLKAFQYLVAAFSLLRSMSFVSGDPSARNIVNRLALCIFFSLVLFQVFFWFDIVNPGMSVRSKRIWNTFLAVNFVFYTFVLVLQLVSPATPVELDDESRVRINFWSDLLPVLLVALGSVGSAGGMLYLSCKMRLRVQRLVDEVPRQTIQAMHRALAFLNGVLLLSSVVFAMRTVFYLQRPWSHKECGAIQDPNVCIFVGYVLPEMVPCILFLALMQQVDPRLWTSSCHASTSETTPLLRKQPASSLFDTPNHVRWQRPLKSPTTITTPLPPRPSPSALGSPPTPHSTAAASEPALWLSIRCIDLHTDSHGPVSTFVVATSIATGSEIGRTEVRHGDNSSPMYYRVLLNVPTLQGALRLQVFALHDVASLVMEAVVDDPSTLVPGHAMSFRRDEDGAMALPDGLLMIRCEAVSSVEPTFQRLARAFVWPEMTLLAEEELVESPFTWSIPYQLLQVIVVDLADKLDRLTDAATSEIESSLAVATSPREGDEDDGGGNRSLLSDMIFHLQGNKRRRSNHKWRVEMIQRMEMYLAQVRSVLQTYEAGPVVTFKPSTKKADPDLRFVALNLHAQMLTLGSAIPDEGRIVASEATWDDAPPPTLALKEVPPFKNYRLFGTVTVGAFAAHVYGFGQGGFVRIRLRELSMQAIGADLAVLQRDMHALEWHIDQRLDVAFSQAMTALVTSFSQTLYVHLHASDVAGDGDENRKTPALYLQQLERHGFLFSVESLLSTVGAEAGMLGDMDAAVKALAHVTLQLQVVCPSGVFDMRMSSRGSSGLTIELPLIDAREKALPTGRRVPGQAAPVSLSPSSCSSVNHLAVGTRLDIAVVPVLFNQGMNELQTVANTVGRSQLQEDINIESSIVLEAYLTAVSTSPDVLRAWEGVKGKIQQAKAEKVMDIVATTSWIARQVGGGRVTCCKSGKDRTAMSVTLEEATWMADHAATTISSSSSSHVDMDQASRQGGWTVEWTQLLRTYGVRRENARKNIGKAQYAFNTWQNYLLPSEYKCPPGTGGGGTS
ncbi:hypothetical protein DYB26_004943 [Aphanomyces astaci]|uniref:THH1/TOM1/TOM3 domain-containing protein n=1 Tax=Aphanomyces astaci TaxID=112090 RepID=A0A3R6WGK8_APHAT|nr:hypothetical protein DYB26_004943 [Aphanomyces astaci]